MVHMMTIMTYHIHMKSISSYIYFLVNPMILHGYQFNDFTIVGVSCTSFDER